jgi:hypothetical protein
MPRRPPAPDSDEGIALEIGGNIRDIALSQMADGLRGLGVPQRKIDAAVIESKRINSDEPMKDLAMPRIRKMEREMEGTFPEKPATKEASKIPDDVVTKSKTTANEFRMLLKARNSLIWIVSNEEARVEDYLMNAAATRGYNTRTWDVGQGIVMSLNAKPEAQTNDPIDAFNLIKAWAERPPNNPTLPRERAIWIMRDLPAWIDPERGARTLRVLRNLAKFLPNTPLPNAQVVVVLSPSANVPPELSGHAVVINWPMPDRTEIAALLDSTVASQAPDVQTYIRTKMTSIVREAAIDAAVGLNGEEAQSCYSKSIVRFRGISPVMVAKEKKRIITRGYGLEWYDPLPGGLDAVGGLDNLKGWLLQRKVAYTPAARKYGLQAPKGALIVGITGTGKSLTAKATATAWGVPLIKMDLGGMKSKFVGDSESNLRKAFDIIKAVGRCVVWWDEIEKSLQGATSGSADGGVSADALGTILTWMQEQQGEAFVIATANDVTALPPELLRAGRFDVLWFVDLPNPGERPEILKAALREHNRDENLKFDFTKLTAATQGFTGSEIAALVPEAMFTAFQDGGREITTNDLLAVAKEIHPISKTAEDKIKKLREWQKERGARPATSPTFGSTGVAEIGRKRVLDLEDSNFEDDGDNDETS